MRLKLIFILLIATFLLSACGDKEPVDDLRDNYEPTGVKEVEPKEEPKVEPVKVEEPEDVVKKEPEPKVIVEKSESIAPDVKEEEEVLGMDEDVAALIKRADDKVKSFSFYNSPPPDNLARDYYHVRGSMVRIDLYDVLSLTPENYYDVVFLNYNTKEAVGYCLGLSKSCPDQIKSFEIEFDDYDIPTPYTWTKRIKTGKIEGSEMLDDRKYAKIKTVFEGKPSYIWVDEYSGLTGKVQIGMGDEATIYLFNNLAIGNVDEATVAWPE